ncbi:MAG: XrtA system polysaccharide deacetylase [Pseudomonadota bacterium]
MHAANAISTKPETAKFAMSVDVEDYFQVWAFSDVISRQSWDGYALRVGEMTRRCLDLFDANDIKATFFTLGWVAERDQALVKEIAARGHEVASHGYDHTKVTDQSRDEFFADISKTKSMLEDLCGVDVKGYRAAGFSICDETPWAYEALAQAGYLYSSSTHPISHDHYGDAQAPQTPYRPLSSSPLIEAPVATVKLLGKRVSAAGGGWFRAAPLPLSKALLSKASASLDGPVIFYFHPWEIDPDQPRMKRAKRKSKLRHYLGLRHMEAKLQNVLRCFAWGRIDRALGLGAGS